jgi:hypothetical protein
MPYIAINGRFKTGFSFDEVIERISASYESINNFSNEPTYLADTISEECCVFLCATQKMTCAFLVLGGVSRRECPSNISNPVLFTLERVSAVIEACTRRTGLIVEIENINTEISLISH